MKLCLLLGLSRFSLRMRSSSSNACIDSSATSIRSVRRFAKSLRLCFALCFELNWLVSASRLTLKLCVQRRDLELFGAFEARTCAELFPMLQKKLRDSMDTVFADVKETCRLMLQH